MSAYRPASEPDWPDYVPEAVRAEQDALIDAYVAKLERGALRHIERRKRGPVKPVHHPRPMPKEGKQ